MPSPGGGMSGPSTPKTLVCRRARSSVERADTASPRRQHVQNQPSCTEPLAAPLSISAPLDLRIVGFTALVSFLAAIIFGLAPAWRATQLDLSPSLKDGRTTSGGRWFGWGRTLVVTQVALSLTLLVGAGLFIRSLVKLRSVDLGFQREHVMVFSVDPQLINYKREQIGGLYQQMLERIGTVPGVTSVSLGRQGLLSGSGTQGSIRLPGFTPPPQENQVTRSGDNVENDVPYLSQVGPNFFRTLGMMIVRGRDISPQDNETSPKVAVVNEAFARYYFANQDPIGRRFDRGEEDGGDVLDRYAPNGEIAVGLRAGVDDVDLAAGDDADAGLGAVRIRHR